MTERSVERLERMIRETEDRSEERLRLHIRNLTDSLGSKLDDFEQRSAVKSQRDMRDAKDDSRQDIRDEIRARLASSEEISSVVLTNSSCRSNPIKASQKVMF